MELGDMVTIGTEQARVIELGDDGWVKVRYLDGDQVWTPPEAVIK